MRTVLFVFQINALRLPAQALPIHFLQKRDALPASILRVLRDFAKQGLPVMECFQTRLPAQALRYLFLRQVNSTSRG